MGSLKNFNDLCVKISDMKNMFEFDTVIETGCFKGDSLDYISNLDYLQEIYSCDIESTFVDLCRRKFSNNSRIQIHNQSSYEFLLNLLSTLKHKDSILFWLDAHNYKPHISSRSDIDFPILKELDIISNLRKNKNDVIIIDDVYTYIEDPNNHKNNLKVYQTGIKSIKSYGYKTTLYSADKGYLLLTR